MSRGETESQSDADFLDITFTNRGDAACMVHGYPTLTMRDGNGRSMGDRATLRTSGAARYIVLEPGATATATVRFPKATDACTSGTARIEVLIPAATERDVHPREPPVLSELDGHGDPASHGGRRRLAPGQQHQVITMDDFTLIIHAKFGGQVAGGSAQ